MSYFIVANLRLWCLVARKIFSQYILTMGIIMRTNMKGNKDQLKHMTGSWYRQKNSEQCGTSVRNTINKIWQPSVILNIPYLNRELRTYIVDGKVYYTTREHLKPRSSSMPRGVNEYFEPPNIIIHSNAIYSYWHSFSQYNNSTIHKVVSSLVTGRSQKHAGWNAPQRLFLPAVPIDSQWTLFCSTGIVPVEIMEWPGIMRLAPLWIALLSYQILSELEHLHTSQKQQHQSSLQVQLSLL